VSLDCATTVATRTTEGAVGVWRWLVERRARRPRVGDPLLTAAERRDVVRRRVAGERARDIARAFDCSPRTIQRVTRVTRDTGISNRK
jgi:DNA invertase Pin-like site-specific DNA recombinase